MDMIFFSQKYFYNPRKYKEIRSIVSRVLWDINFAEIVKLLIVILLSTNNWKC